MNQYLRYCLGACLALAAFASFPAHAEYDTPPYPPSCLQHWPERLSGGPANPEVTATLQVRRIQPLYQAGTIPMTVKIARVPCTATQSVLVVSTTEVAPQGPISGGVLPYFTVKPAGATQFLHLFATRNAFPAWRVTSISHEFHQNANNDYILFSAAADINGPITIKIDSGVDTPRMLTMPAYVPTAEILQARPLDSFVAGHYFDPAHPGEGIIVESIGSPDAQGNSYLRFTWLTYDRKGDPFWLAGGDSVNARARSARLPAVRLTGGRFGGQTTGVSPIRWGTVEVSFPDCNTLRLSYASDPSNDPAVPQGTGQLEWKRLSKPSGHACD
ncbi:hypothetical protein [Tahibacter amnicola]|uniref:Uncharacterized protein n=1 Tax=Tahibacter amnicola TaxID=2976241 RepID=A0ABY6BHR2_9GAMM|nr:hypothetical protein [Tahibacter amnicola]UXI69317.1 hypothetical protein N4264_06620 [Tahibacter amnicola]